jgi:hypothetical protein
MSSAPYRCAAAVINREMRIPSESKALDVCATRLDTEAGTVGAVEPA